MKRILVVDDNNAILEILHADLEARGYEVFTLFDYEEVFDSIKEFSPDVILLDVYLGAMNGTDLCREIKSNAETMHIPVVIFSAHAKANIVFNTCHADAFVGKPFDLDELAGVLQSQIDKTLKYFSPPSKS